MAFGKNLEEVWHWKDEVARETENLTAEEQIDYFRKVSRDFLNKEILEARKKTKTKLS